jgi:amino-acid N-acetyltransferase
MSNVFHFTFVPWFRSVAPYIHKFRHQTFVVGITGEAIAAGKLPNLVQDLALIQSMGVRVVLVHGFRPQVDEQLRAKGHAARFHNGMRITDSVGAGTVAPRGPPGQFALRKSRPPSAWGCPTPPWRGATVRVISGNFITARPVGIVDGIDFQHSGLGAQGRHRGHRARARHGGPWCCCRRFGFFRPRARRSTSTWKEVATSVAVALQADKLIFVTEGARHPRAAVRPTRR